MTPSGPSLDQPAEAAAFPVASCGGSWNVSSRARSFSICEGLNRSEPIERSARLANTRNHNQLAEPSQYNPITPDGRKTADALSGIGLPMHVSKNAAMFFLLSSDWFYTCQPLLLGNSLEARLDTPRRTHPASWRWRKTEGSSPPSSGPWPWRLPSTPRSSDPSPLQDPGSTAPHQHTLLRRGGARSTPTAGAQRPRAPRP
jgi:hypothetical protein